MVETQVAAFGYLRGFHWHRFFARPGGRADAGGCCVRVILCGVPEGYWGGALFRVSGDGQIVPALAVDLSVLATALANGGRDPGRSCFSFARPSRCRSGTGTDCRTLPELVRSPGETRAGERKGHF